MDFLTQVLENSLRARLLRLFFNAEEEAFSVDDIGRRARVHQKKTLEKELERLVEIGIVRTRIEKVDTKGRGKTKHTTIKKIKVWALDRECPHAQTLRAFVFETEAKLGREPEFLEKLRRVGRLRLVIASTSFFSGGSGATIDFLVVGEGLDEKKMEVILGAIEAEQGREIRYAAFSSKEYKYRLDVQDRLIRDLLDYPHTVLLDRT